MAASSAIGVWAAPQPVPDLDDDTLRIVHRAELQRIETIQRVLPAVVCIFDKSRSGAGSGVLIDSAGYGLTNYHVVASMLRAGGGLGGLNNGKVYPFDVLGIDITGDVAMFRLKSSEPFPFAPLGDSDALRIGDPVIAMGNPFSLAESDNEPTVTTGIVTGVHRYQGENETLVYTDCIQTDAAINPGNSGGPLFDRDGRVVGINGRISAEMHKYARGRFNVGLGYAISINQIKRFMPSLRAGLLSKHGTLLATVVDDIDRVLFDDLYEDAPAWDAGIRVGNRLLRFGGVDIRSANQFLRVLGTYPMDWPVPITFESYGRIVHRVVRLEGVTPPMKKPYEAAESVNREAFETAVDAFRLAVLGSDSPGAPRSWSWESVRKSNGETVARYRARDVRGRITQYIELDSADRPARRIEIDDRGAKVIEDSSRGALGTEEAMFHTAMRELRWNLLQQESLWKREEARHVGSDALVAIDASGHIVRQRSLEAISFKLSEHVQLRIGFELDSHLPARLVVRDLPSGMELEIELDDYREVAGVTWPHRMRVRSPKLDFTETIENLELKW